MKVVSWNCRGMGKQRKKEDLGKLIHSEKPSILLIQETKLRDTEILLEMQKNWKKSKGSTISARGASGGLCTLWNSELFLLDEIFQETNWIMVKLIHLASGKIYHIVNIYMPNNYWEKVECWNSLLSLASTDPLPNLI
jgi:exonuclease III